MHSHSREMYARYFVHSISGAQGAPYAISWFCLHSRHHCPFLNRARGSILLNLTAFPSTEVQEATWT